MRERENPLEVNYVWRDVTKLVAPAFRVMDNIYYVGNRNVSSHLIASEEGHILIDTGYRTTVPLLLESIRKLGFNPRDIRIILNTHAHVDHTGGNRKMIEETGAKVYIGEEDVEAVEGGTPLTCAHYWYGIEDFETFKVDRALRDGDAINVGNKNIRAYHTPGHTPGACSYEIEVTSEGRRLNAFLFGAPGQWTFQKVHRSQGYPGDLEDYSETMSRLGAIDVGVWLGVHPNQNRTFEKAGCLGQGSEENPFRDPQGWKRFLKGLDLNFRRILKQKFGDYLEEEPKQPERGV